MMRKGDLIRAWSLGAAANFPWEMAHSRFYRGIASVTWNEHLQCCFLASLADGVGIAVIFTFGALAFREPRWTCRPLPVRLGLTALLGLAGAIVAEWMALRLGWWSYGVTMPRVPGTQFGLTPFMQFIVVPLGVLFWALPRWWNCRDREDTNAERTAKRIKPQAAVGSTPFFGKTEQSQPVEDNQ